MKKRRERRGLPIGAYTSQLLGNFCSSLVDHHMKEKAKCRHYLKYCDDVCGLTKTKAEAWAQLNEYIKKSEELGLVVKASYIVAPVAHKEARHGKKKRRRQRGRKKN